MSTSATRSESEKANANPASGALIALVRLLARQAAAEAVRAAGDDEAMAIAQLQPDTSK